METITVNNKSFNIVKLLGKGKGGYSYLADDGCRQYVVKKSIMNHVTTTPLATR